jgi:hypothetical protein
MDQKQIKNFNILYWKFFDYIPNFGYKNSKKRKKKIKSEKIAGAPSSAAAAEVTTGSDGCRCCSTVIC